MAAVVGIIINENDIKNIGLFEDTGGTPKHYMYLHTPNKSLSVGIPDADLADLKADIENMRHYLELPEVTVGSSNTSTMIRNSLAVEDTELKSDIILRTLSNECPYIVINAEVSGALYQIYIYMKKEHIDMLDTQSKPVLDIVIPETSLTLATAAKDGANVYTLFQFEDNEKENETIKIYIPAGLEASFKVDVNAEDTRLGSITVQTPSGKTLKNGASRIIQSIDIGSIIVGYLSGDMSYVMFTSDSASSDYIYIVTIYIDKDNFEQFNDAVNIVIP